MTTMKTLAPVKTFRAGLVVKLTKDVACGAGKGVAKAGTIAVIAAPFETTDQAGWSYDSKGRCMAIHAHEATDWDFGAFDR